MKELEVYEIVEKLIGKTMPVGASHIDSKRLDNLDDMIELTEAILDNISEIAQMSIRVEHSMKTAGERAINFLKSISDIYFAI